MAKLFVSVVMVVIALSSVVAVGLNPQPLYEKDGESCVEGKTCTFRYAYNLEKTLEKNQNP